MDEVLLSDKGCDASVVLTEFWGSMCTMQSIEVFALVLPEDFFKVTQLFLMRHVRDEHSGNGAKSCSVNVHPSTVQRDCTHSSSEVTRIYTREG